MYVSVWMYNTSRTVRVCTGIGRQKLSTPTPCVCGCPVPSVSDSPSSSLRHRARVSFSLLFSKTLAVGSRFLAILWYESSSARSLPRRRLLWPSSAPYIKAYFRCGSEFLGRKVFDEMASRNLYSWNNVLSRYAKLGRMRPERKMFNRIPKRDIVSWNTMLIRCLCAYARFADLKRGKQIHAHLIRTNFGANTIVVGSLVDMYSKCGNLGYAQLIFDRVNDKKEVILWNADVCLGQFIDMSMCICFIYASFGMTDWIKQ
ncbi:hypothetical protein CRG98_037345 [Punica granatum]|uniref:Pentatricopeptide repeat-containing protein n=1 Tax=Punica granatum TaxID=22663 RepID=A0A2I0IE04_PUNGR|nr:hypothetical protein CRG98_037345 [Punica granatum]